MPHRHPAAHIQMQRIELRRPANFRHLGNGLLKNMHGRNIRPQMEMHRLHPDLGRQQFLEHQNRRVRLQTELRGTRRAFGVEFLARQNPHAQAPILLFGRWQQHFRFHRRIKIHNQPGQFKSRQPMMFGRAVDQDVFRGKPFRQRGAQFKFADHLNGPSLRTPPIQQGPQRLGFEG